MMVVRARKLAEHKWIAEVVVDGTVVYAGRSVEPRLGCAVRSTLNYWQTQHGAPAGNVFEMSLEDW